VCTRLYGAELGVFVAVVSATALPLLVALDCAAQQAPIEPAGLQQAKVIVGENGEFFGNARAERLVQEAKKSDPMFCPQEQRDRDKAALLYEQAIDAQPGAKYNAVLADRVAQMYATYEDKKKNVVPVPDRAIQWWNRCLELTNPKQLLWAQAQMGLASTAIIKGDAKSAAAAYDNILRVDANQIELEDWKFWPESDRYEAQRKREIERLQKSVWQIQNRALEEWRAAEKTLCQKPDEPRWKSEMFENKEAFCALFKPGAYGAGGSEMDRWDAELAKGGDERIAQLQEAIRKYPNSPYADDAALLLARAVFLYRGDADRAISGLSDVIKQYPDGEWIAEDPVVVNDIALGMVGSSGNGWKRVPFSGGMTEYMREVMSYMEYVYEHPNRTSDEAKYWISWIIFRTKNEQRYQEAEELLRGVIARHKDAGWTQADLKAAKQLQNKLVANAMRTERMAYWLLVPLLKRMGKDAAAVEAAAEAKRIEASAARKAAAQAIDVERSAFLRTIEKPPVSTPDLPKSVREKMRQMREPWMEKPRP